MYYNDYATTESLLATTVDSTPLLGMFFGIMIFSTILCLISVISYWKLFKKAGKPGWASIIPIYNNIVMIEIAKLSMLYLLLLFIPIANIFATFKINIEIAKKFGKTSGFGIGMTLIPIIFVPLLAFADSKYEENNKSNIGKFDASNIINDNQVMNTTVNMEPQFNTIENNIEVEQSIQVENPNIESNENVLNNIPVMENTQVEDIANVAEENISAEQNNINNQAQSQNINVIETSVENPNVEPIINSVNDIATLEQKVEEKIEDPVNMTLDKTVVDPIANVTNEVQTEQVQPEVNLSNENAFNIKPTAEISNTVNNENIGVQNAESTTIEPVQITEIPSPNVNIEQKKVCKSCGAELPEIVSICPNCGTDNE